MRQPDVIRSPRRARRAAAGRQRTSALRVIAVLSLAASLASCGPRNFQNVNDQLRSQVRQLETQLAQARAERDETAAKLAEAERSRATPLPPDVLAALPRCAGVDIDSVSGVIDADSTPGWDAIDVVLDPYDGRRRFVQVAGRVTVDVTMLAPPGDGAPPPQRIAFLEVSPTELREAYRAGMLSSPHYTIRVPLTKPNVAIECDLVVRVELLDAVTAVTYRSERIIKQRPLPARAAK